MAWWYWTTLGHVLQFGLRLGLVDLQWRIQDLPGGGPRRARGGSGDGAPSVVQGLPEPLRGAGKLKALCSFSYKKWPNVTDLNEKLPPCLRQTASPSHAQPALSFSQWGRGGVGGGGRPVCPLLDSPSLFWTLRFRCRSVRTLRHHGT